MDHILTICEALLGGTLGGLAVSYGLRFAINRRCYRLEIALADIQRIVASLKGVEYGARRWNKKEMEERELRELRPLPQQQAVKYDNDWTTGRPD